MSELYLTLRSRLEEVTNWVILGREVMRNARNAKGLSYEAVGRSLSVSAKTYERWERQGRVPRGDLDRLAKVIGLQVEHPSFEEPVVILEPEATPQGGDDLSAWMARVEGKVDEALRRLDHLDRGDS